MIRVCALPCDIRIYACSSRCLSSLRLSCILVLGLTTRG